MVIKMNTKRWRGNCPAEDGGYCTAHGLNAFEGVPCWGTPEKPCNGYIITRLVEGGEFGTVVKTSKKQKEGLN